MEISAVTWGYLAKKIGGWFRRMFKFFKNASGATVRGRAQSAFNFNGRRLHLLPLEIIPGTLPSEFDRIETNGTLFWAERVRGTRYSPGEQLKNPCAMSLNVLPSDKPRIILIFVEAAKEGPTEILFKGKTKEELRWFQSL